MLLGRATRDTSLELTIVQYLITEDSTALSKKSTIRLFEVRNTQQFF